MAENKEYTINGMDFKETKQYKYYVKETGTKKWNRVNKAVFVDEIAKAKDGKPMVEIFVGSIPKNVARKLTRRYAKGRRSAVNWFNEVSSLMNTNNNEIKRLLKAV